jgi:lysozyme family protein
MEANRNQVLKYIGLSEGGYVNNPKDPGGPTDRGITQKTYDAWNDLKKRPRKAVKGITQMEADNIIYEQYMLPVKFSSLPSGVDYAVVDFSVNSGASAAVKVLQRVLGLKEDGVLGVVTLAAINKVDPAKLILEYGEARMKFLKSLKTWNTFGKGWTKRVMGDQEGAQTDDIGVVDRATKMIKMTTLIPDPKPVGTNKSGDAKAVWWDLLLGLLEMIVGNKK